MAYGVFTSWELGIWWTDGAFNTAGGYETKDDALVQVGTWLLETGHGVPTYVAVREVDPVGHVVKVTVVSQPGNIPSSVPEDWRKPPDPTWLPYFMGVLVAVSLGTLIAFERSV